MKTNLEKLLFESDGMPIEQVRDLLENMIVQKQRWIGTHHPDSNIRKEAFRYSGLEIGEEVFISMGMVVLDSQKYNPIVTIRDRCAFGNYVSFIGGSSPNDSLLRHHPYVSANCIKESPIYVGEDVWIGSGAIILPGITIGEKSIIGAGAVVNKNIPPYSMAVGVPVKVTKELTGGDWEK